MQLNREGDRRNLPIACVAAFVACVLAVVMCARTAWAESATPVSIQYDSQDGIHYVMEKDSSGNEQKVILFCMNNSLHWPHTTEAIPEIPNYYLMDIDDFVNANVTTGKDTFAAQLKALLYAGYPYNGMGLYEISSSVPQVTEAEFDSLLVQPAYLGTDFPGSIGETRFSYSDYTSGNTENMSKLTAFVQAVTSLYISDGTTESGLTAEQIRTLPFYKAAESMAYASMYGTTPLGYYSYAYAGHYYVTQKQAYDNTSAAIWNLMYNSGVGDNTGVSGGNLSETLSAAAVAGTDQVLSRQLVSSDVSITGDTTFKLDKDGKWYSGTLTLNAPSTYQVAFTLGLPEGITTTTEATTVKAGESFRLVSSSKPADAVTVTASASVPWMDGDLRVYQPEEGKTASDGTGFQYMIGAIIRTDTVTASTSVTRKDTSVKVTKVWDDADNQDGLRRPVQVELLANGEVLKSAELDASNGWSHTFENLPATSNGTAITYTVNEKNVPDGYSWQVTGNASEGFTITNSHTPATTSVSGTKTWEGSSVLPESITVRLHANGEVVKTQEVTPDAHGTWSYSFENLPKYEDGTEIVYSVTEDAIDDWSATKDGYDFTNTYTPGKTSLFVSKEWDDAGDQDGLRPESVTVYLLADGERTGDALVLSADNNWSGDFTELLESKDGQAIVYTVEEGAVAGYTQNVTEGNPTTGYVIVNTHTPATTSVSGTKTWTGDGNPPASITVRLHANGVPVDSQVVTADDGWTYSFTGLPTYENGEEIVYSITEDALDGWSASESDFDLTNAYTPGETSVFVSKEWDDNDDADGLRPESVTVRLYANGERTEQTLVLSAANHWTGDFAELPEWNSDGTAITYTVAEDAVSGYVAEVDGDAVEGFEIVNSRYDEPEPEPTPTPSDDGGSAKPASAERIPDTGDPSGALGLLVIAGAAALALRRRLQ